MIPDKIYVREYPVGLNQEWDEKPMVKTVAIAQHEYISKDALIEILQGYSHPLTKLVIQEIIDKINSL